MSRLRVLFSKLMGLFRKARLEQQLDEDVRAHLEMLTEENLRKGMDPEEARYAAMRQFGNVSSMKEECRDTWSVRIVEELIQDVRYGLRQFRRTPGFTVVAVLTLALGIGANTSIFSLIDAVMLKTLPVKNPEQLTLLSWVSQKNPSGLDRVGGAVTFDPTGRVTGLPFPYPTFEEFQRDSTVFSSFFGFDPFGSVNISAEGRANVAEEELVTGDYFSGLGVAPILGRSITREDEKAGAPSVALISYGFWSRYFNRSPAAVGKGITINGVPCTVIGVAPPQFFGVTPGRAVDVWVPLVQNTRLLPPILVHTPGESSPFTSQTSWWVEMMGRLKPGVTQRQARAQLEVLFQQSRRSLNARAIPQSTPHVRVTSGAKGLASIRQEFATPLWILTVIVGIVLLIACANIAALLVARSAARQREIALRLSLGASRGRLVRQLLTESVLLAGFGGIVGLLFAGWATQALVLLMPSGARPLNLSVHLDARVLAFTAAVSILTGILFGFTPALRSMRTDMTPALKAGTGGKSTLGKRTRMGLAKALVTTQISLALLLSIGAGLFVLTLKELEGQNLGFDQYHLLLFTVDPSRNGYEGKRLMEFYAQLRSRLHALPGVESATMSLAPPVYGNSFSSNVPVSVEGHKLEHGQNVNADWNTVGPSFFKTLGIPLLMGRGIESRDTTASPRVVVVNEAFAREAFGGRNPIGYTVRFPFPVQSNPVFEIVGVVRDARFKSLREAPRPTIYIPYTQMPTWAAVRTFELRTQGDPLAHVATVRHVVHDLDPDVPISDVRTQTRQIAEALMQERLFGLLSSFFGALAVLLACVGLYGVISYSVNQRTYEIGIRMALGAEKRDVLKMVIGQGLRLAVIGVAIGIAGALALTRFLSSLLYGVKPTDPVTFIAVSLILIAVALVACYIPARRASKVDPMVALRYE